jgi:hypothetical protein
MTRTATTRPSCTAEWARQEPGDEAVSAPAVERLVIHIRDQLKVFDPVVVLTAITVMDYLARRERSSEVLLHHPAMFEHLSPRDAEHHVAGARVPTRVLPAAVRGTHEAPAVARVAARPAAELRDLRSSRTYFERTPALSAGEQGRHGDFLARRASGAYRTDLTETTTKRLAQLRTWGYLRTAGRAAA